MLRALNATASAQNKDSVRFADAQFVRSPTTMAGLLLPYGVQGPSNPVCVAAEFSLPEHTPEPRRTKLQASPGIWLIHAPAASRRAAKKRSLAIGRIPSG